MFQPNQFLFSSFSLAFLYGSWFGRLNTSMCSHHIFSLVAGKRWSNSDIAGSPEGKAYKDRVILCSCCRGYGQTLAPTVISKVWLGNGYCPLARLLPHRLNSCSQHLSKVARIHLHGQADCLMNRLPPLVQLFSSNKGLEWGQGHLIKALCFFLQETQVGYTCRCFRGCPSPL